MKKRIARWIQELRELQEKDSVTVKDILFALAVAFMFGFVAKIELDMGLVDMEGIAYFLIYAWVGAYVLFMVNCYFYLRNQLIHFILPELICPLFKAVFKKKPQRLQQPESHEV